MAEHWISAAAARDIVAQPRSPAAGTRALCERAYAALVKTKARLFTVKNLGRRQENVEVPAAFWWAGGHEALTQDWTTGDFSTWINNNEQWQAFGVTFALSGVLEMLPFEQRAVTARRLSVAGSPAWMPARAALRFARKEGGIDAASAKKAILEQAHLGFVTGRAVLAQRFDGPILSRDPSWEGREWDVPDWFWRGSTVKDHSRQDWESGWFSAEGPGPSGDCLMNLTGVYFLTESLQVLALAKHDEPREVATKARAGGQPPPSLLGRAAVRHLGPTPSGGLQA